jgi:predicted alpha/beta-fold hydrolase
VPLVKSRFGPPGWLEAGHLQTVLPAVLGIGSRAWTPSKLEDLELPDGDFLTLAWGRRSSGRVAVLSHGLEGDWGAPYIREMARALEVAGWDVLAWNFRGCGQVPNRLLRFYHAGAVEDLAAVVRRARADYSCLALVGFSLGANLLLQYVASAAFTVEVQAAAAVSAPIDLKATALALDQRPGNAIYRHRFLKTLRRKILSKAIQFPGQIDIRRLDHVLTFEEFDGRFTAPLHGFSSAAEYWGKSSALHTLDRIPIPTLLLNARNDPLLTPGCFPEELAARHPLLHLEAPASGGHVGFLSSLKKQWTASRVPEFLSTHVP